MLSFTLFFFPFVSKADELFWVDYDSSLEYNWEYLQQDSDYTLPSKTGQVYFNFGKNIEQSCEGHKAAVMFFDNSRDYCAIIGRQESYHVTPYSENSGSGVILLYESGGLCSNRYYSNLKHRVEFKFICSKVESSFVLSTDAHECTTIIEKKGKCGCAEEYKTSLLTKILLFSIYSFLAGLLIWICVETFDESGSTTSKIANIAKGKIFSTGLKDSYEVV